MSVLSQSLLALVRGHLVSLMLLSVWHNYIVYGLVHFSFSVPSAQNYCFSAI